MDVLIVSCVLSVFTLFIISLIVSDPTKRKFLEINTAWLFTIISWIYIFLFCILVNKFPSKPEVLLRNQIKISGIEIDSDNKLMIIEKTTRRPWGWVFFTKGYELKIYNYPLGIEDKPILKITVE
jgi:hypothetical protein